MSKSKQPKVFGIYKIWFENSSFTPDGGYKLYVGLGILARRRSEHLIYLKKNLHFNSLLQRAFNKYGLDNFRFEVIEECVEDKLDEREIYWIAQFKCNNREFGYNFTSGGQRTTMNEEARQKKSESMKGNKNGVGRIVPEHAKIATSIANKGNKHGLGKKHSAESIEKYKKTRKENGKQMPKWSEERRRKQNETMKDGHTDEAKKKISDASKEMWKTRRLVPITEQTREKMRQAGLNRPEVSDETRRKLSESLKKVEHTKEWNEKVSKALTGKKLSPEHAAKCGKGNLGKRRTAEERENARQVALLRVEREKQEKANGTFVEKDKAPKYNRREEGCGTFKVIFDNSDFEFIGATPKLTRQSSYILRRLRAGLHANKEMQKQYDLHGDLSFKFIILEHCSLEELKNRGLV